jgi:aspartate aminotransferase-like enzyme
MQDKLMLMIPGPTPVPERVLLAMAQHPMGHRSGDFSKIIGELNENLKWLHQTKNEVLTLCASGTGAMEAGIINFLSAGDKVLVGNNGKFGERWGILSRAFGLDVEEVTAEWGKQLDPEDFRAKLEADSEKKIKAVIITHSETSTGVLNDLETINKHVKAHGEALIIVDAVTSLGAVNVPMDEWGLDVVASGSQKGYMIPPGMGFVAVSDKAWEAYKTATLPKFYLDLAPYKKANAKNSSPFTPPINLMFALEASLKMMKEEGLQNIFDRHKLLTKVTREGVKALGLPLYTSDEAAALAITAVIPDKHDAEAIRSTMRKRFDIVLAGGQDHLSGKIFRMGHLGFVSERDVLTALAALKETLAQLG